MTRSKRSEIDVAVTEEFVSSSLTALTVQLQDDIRTSIEQLKENILNRLVADNIKLRKKCSVLEEKLMDPEDRFYDLEVDVAQGQQHSTSIAWKKQQTYDYSFHMQS